jgi:hypothetical protein
MRLVPAGLAIIDLMTNIPYSRAKKALAITNTYPYVNIDVLLLLETFFLTVQ